MVAEARRAPPVLALVLAIPSLFAAAPARALRIVSYNIYSYPGGTSGVRNPYFRTVLGSLAADIVVVQEMNTSAGVTEFLNNVLNTLEPGKWGAFPFIDGGYDNDNALFFRKSALDTLGQWAWFPNPDSALRLVNCYRLRPKGYTGEGAELRLYSQHLAAHDDTDGRARRTGEAAGIRDSMNQMTPDSHAILLGDFNLYRSSETALQLLTQSQADDDGRVYDPLNAAGDWHDGASFASIHTQCPCILTSAGGHCPADFAGGGLDDRFDIFLPTTNMNDGQGLELLPATYRAVGQDGQHLNKEITSSPRIPEGDNYAKALRGASDHLPIRVDVRLPALSIVAAALDLGTSIGGSSAALGVSNPAASSCDALSYSFTPPPGFTAPAGSFELAPGGSTSHAIGTGAAPPGPRSGNLTITSDDPDHPSRLVALTANVLDHARPSLDQASEQLAATADFGTHEEGGFSPQTVTVRNFGYSAAQARLSLMNAVISGGGGRFSIVGGFNPSLVAGSGQPYGVAFDAAGAPDDLTYTATLTFTSVDEPLPGATTRPNLEVALTARVGSSPVDAPTSLAVPTRTRLHPPFPNPLSGSSRVRLDLARRADLRLEVLDLAGRHVATLARGWIEPGRYTYSWPGRGDAGEAVPTGVYFIRLSGGGLGTESARLAVVR